MVDGICELMIATLTLFSSYYLGGRQKSCKYCLSKMLHFKLLVVNECFVWV